MIAYTLKKLPLTQSTRNCFHLRKIVNNVVTFVKLFLKLPLILLRVNKHKHFIV